MRKGKWEASGVGTIEDDIPVLISSVTPIVELVAEN
jgi:hypothetical protein